MYNQTSRGSWEHHILTLIDSGSASSFISQALADKLQCHSQDMAVVQFTVADGAPVQCTTYVPDFEWAVQGHTFHHTVNVLQLGCYDMILGKDWLDLYSPMWVHWKRQILCFHTQGTLHYTAWCSFVEANMQSSVSK